MEEIMKIIADTHAHTLVSGHAYSTIKEMVAAGKEKGLEVLAFTEHAPKMPGSCDLFYFQNLKILPREMQGMHVLFGVELNIMDDDGTVDLPASMCEKLDIVIASMHTPCYGPSKSKEENTAAYVKAMHLPYVNIIGHPDDSRFPIDYETLVKTAKETNTLLEVNNSSMRPGSFRQGAFENISTMLELCKQYEVPITTGTDAHYEEQTGDFGNVERVIKACGFPEELVMTTDFEKLKPYLNRFKEQ